MSGRTTLFAIGGFVLLALLLNSFFVLSQVEQALVTRFGAPVAVHTTPGLKFKMPFTDAVEIFDDRILVLNADPETVILRDQDRLIVDAYVTYRIRDPLVFYQAVRNERNMNELLEKALETSLREVMGREDLSTLLSPKRSAIMDEIRGRVSRLASGKGSKTSQDAAQAALAFEEDGVTPVTPVLDENGDMPTPSEVAERVGYGIEVVDVRIMRTDLPKQTSDPIYNRMRSDRQKVAEKFRAEGSKEAQIIRSEADKERTIMIADAERQSAVIRGEGDGLATKIFADSFGKDAEFFDFYRSLEAYRASLKDSDTTVILSPDHRFLKHLGR